MKWTYFSETVPASDINKKVLAWASGNTSNIQFWTCNTVESPQSASSLTAWQTNAAQLATTNHLQHFTATRSQLGPHLPAVEAYSKDMSLTTQSQ